LPAAEDTEATQTQTESLNDQLIQAKARRIIVRIGSSGSRIGQGGSEVETQGNFLSKSQAELTAMEARVNQYECLLAKETCCVAEYSVPTGEVFPRPWKELEATAENFERANLKPLRKPQ